MGTIHATRCNGKKQQLRSAHAHTQQSETHTGYLRALIYSINNNIQRNVRTNSLYLMCLTHSVASQQAALLSVGGRFISQV